ncbi:MAG: Dyp-type peroxidase [Solirubrobacteraceae bacterium]
MAVNLNTTLAWKTAGGDSLAMLKQLQPNILKGHVREHMQLLFVQFSDRAEARAFLAAVARRMKSANKHLLEAERFRRDGTPGTPYIGVGLSRAGYGKLGIPAGKVPGSAKPTAIPFRRGMRHADSIATLTDPPVAEWEPVFRHTIHAVVLIADATRSGVDTTRAQIDALLTPKVKLLGVQAARGQSNTHGDGIEHFGYVDGRSQPLFLDEDIAAEPHTPAGWNPRFALGRVLVRDSAAPDPARHFGSFLVVRKLEQNVRRFHQSEKNLADALGLIGPDRPRAGATIVGRFRDGTPLTSKATGGVHPVPNDFDYDNDVQGRKCPLHAHIRKVNPRGSGGGESHAGERRHLMARRGQAFGERTDDINAELPPSARPTGGVGLMFMAFNSEISNQFDFTQSTWANNPSFPFGGTGDPGLDQVIGQGRRPKTTCPVSWNGAATKTVSAASQAVTMRGGEYFFAPSIAFLKAL